jgi:hypothetical protein
MREKRRSYDIGVMAILAAAVLSFAFWLVVILLGFHEAPPNAPGIYETYFQQSNWWPYPFFFLALAPVLWLTWEPMLRAWSRLAGTGVLQGPGGGKPDDATVQQVLCAVRRKRRGAVVTSIAIALLINLADLVPNADVLLGTAKLDQQLKLACSYPGPFVKWIFVAQTADPETVCALPAEQPFPGEDSDGIRPPIAQLLFNAILLAQQVLIVLFAALAFMQIMLHTLLFALFERLAVARAHGLHLMLNCRSPLNEFGLEHWNYTLNNFYWAASPAMLGVFLSRAATPPEDYLPGQVMLGFAVPACLIVPMVATIIARQARLPIAWTTVQPDGPVAPEDYRRQQLWPLDRNWSSKLGILLAFALAALSIGFEVSQLVRL